MISNNTPAQQEPHGNTRRIAKNTLMLYFRQILIMIVGLSTVRVVLNTLGAEDYGIYNVVAGVVTMFGFLSNSMATASQRYFSYDLGQRNYAQLKKTFSVTLLIYLLLVGVIFVLAETLGLWFVMNKLVIPLERKTAAFWIYQAAVVSFMLTVMTAPYMASIIAHEDMTVYAYVSIIEVVLKLSIVFVLQILPYDKLIVYGVLLALVAFINTGLYRFYCHRHYVECKFHLTWDKVLFKELVSYSGWNLFGASIGVVKNQIMNILLNLYFGPIVNAARGIASQVSSAVTSFGQNFSTAMRPQVIKTFSSGNKDECLHLVYRGCKMTFFLMLVLTVPLTLEMNYVLKLWLRNPPEYAALFTTIVLIDCLIDSMNYQVMTLAQATGRIRLYQGVVGGILLLNLPVSLIVLRLGTPAYSVLLVSLCLTFVATVVRLFIVKLLTEFSVKRFVFKVFIPCVITAVFSFVIPFFIRDMMQESFQRLLVVVLVSVVSVSLCIMTFGLNKNERHGLVSMVKDKVRGNR